MKQYRVLSIDDAVDGMQLFQDVHDRQGNLLLPAAAVLNETTIRALRRREVEVLRVVDDTATAEQLAGQRERVLQRLDQLFRNSGAQRSAAVLRTAVETYRLEELE